MNWFKMHSDARTDRKIATLSTAQRWVWFCLLCLANEGQERGLVPPMKPKLLAVEVAEGDEALLLSTLGDLVDLEILSEREDGSYSFVHWNERQYAKPSDRPQATAERKRSQRMSRDVTPMSRDVTPMSRDVTPRHATESESESESESEEESLTESISLNEVGLTREKKKMQTRPLKEKEKEKENREIPANFAITPLMRAWAQRDYPAIDLDAETEQFRDYNLARGQPLRNWPAAWRGWIRRAEKFRLIDQKRSNLNGHANQDDGETIPTPLRPATELFFRAARGEA